LNGWIRVTKGRPCIRCAGSSWCCVGETHVLCMRDSSGRAIQMSDGSTGYLFPVNAQAISSRPVRHDRGATAPVEINVAELIEKWTRQTSSGQMSRFADHIGVRASGLMDLRACYAIEHSAWAFGMSDGFGNLVGIRLRNFLGDKWSVKGSRSGVFFPRCTPQDVMVIAEGPTDTAAVLGMGMFCVGRPSCSGGAAELIHCIGRHRVNKVLIISDNDPKHRPDGTPWNPGLEGSIRLQEQLPVPSCIVVLPCKDIREFVNLGGQPRDLEYLVQSMRWSYPKRNENTTRHRPNAFR
jgi:hypothetical protein